MEIVFSVITIVAVLAVFIFFFFIKKKEGKDFIYGIFFVVAFFSGFALYFIGISYGSPEAPTITIVGRAIDSSLRSFGGNFAISGVSALVAERTIFAVAIFIHYIASMIITFLVIIKIFGKNVVNRILICINSFRQKYIIVGLNKKTEKFLSSLTKKQKKRVVLIIDNEQKKKKPELMFRGYKVVVIPKDSDKKSAKENMKRALKTAGLLRYKRLVDVISFNDCDEINLQVAKIITEYICEGMGCSETLNLTEAQKDILSQINIFAHIEYSSFDKVEHYKFTDYSFGRVKFFNLYEMRARKFLMDYPLISILPEEMINTEKGRLYNGGDKGHKDYKIGHIFVGYGKSNKHLLKKSICANQFLGQDFNGVIIDKNATKLKKVFMHTASGLYNNGEILSEDEKREFLERPKEKVNLDFIDCDITHSDFYTIITEQAKNNDFSVIVIALGDDKTSVETALEIRQKLYEAEKACKTKIFVKLNSSTILSEVNLLNDKEDFRCSITVFGKISEVAVKESIIGEELDYIAKYSARSYVELAGDKISNALTSWDTMKEFKRDSNRYAAISIATKLNLLGFMLVKNDGQDNTAVEKEYAAVYNLKLSNEKRAKRKEGKEFVDFIEHDEKGKITDTPRNNLAMLEHQRWNVFHLCNGWTKLPIGKIRHNVRQNEKLKQHACITTFGGLKKLREIQADCAMKNAAKEGKKLSYDKALLDADTICYDYDVMDNLVELLKDSRYKIAKKEKGENKL